MTRSLRGHEVVNGSLLARRAVAIVTGRGNNRLTYTAPRRNSKLHNTSPAMGGDSSPLRRWAQPVEFVEGPSMLRCRQMDRLSGARPRQRDRGAPSGSAVGTCWATHNGRRRHSAAAVWGHMQTGRQKGTPRPHTASVAVQLAAPDWRSRESPITGSGPRTPVTDARLQR